MRGNPKAGAVVNHRVAVSLTTLHAFAAYKLGNVTNYPFDVQILRVAATPYLRLKPIELKPTPPGPDSTTRRGWTYQHRTGESPGNPEKFERPQIRKHKSLAQLDNQQIDMFLANHRSYLPGLTTHTNEFGNPIAVRVTHCPLDEVP
jgi:hypothetical protein